jgi:hypothetical protein
MFHLAVFEFYLSSLNFLYISSLILLISHHHSFKFNIWDFILFAIIQNIYCVIVEFLSVMLLCVFLIVFLHWDFLLWNQVND